jgi:MarR family transcriptional regulator for hemolysin
MTSMPAPPVFPPIGLRLSRTAWGTQSTLAEAMGVSSATVTHHLNALEAQGLVRRWRDDANRRVQRVELTEAGAGLFERLREVAVAHDARLRSKLSDAEALQLLELLDKLRAGLEPG